MLENSNDLFMTQKEMITSKPGVYVSAWDFALKRFNFSWQDNIKLQILKGVSLECKAGDKIALVGQLFIKIIKILK